MSLDLFANRASTTVSSGGNTAPASGTSENWTVTSSILFPAASIAATPPTQFRVIDRDSPSEIMIVTNVSGTTWTVTRGAEGTAAVAHAAGWTVQNIITVGGLDGRYAPMGGSLFESYVRANSLDQFAQPQAVTPWNGQRISNLGAPAATSDAAQAYGALIAQLVYAPGGFGVTYNVNSTTPKAVDATNLTTSFTAISAAVLVELQCSVQSASSGTPDTSYPLWGLATHGTPSALQGGWAAPVTMNTVPGYVNGHVFVLVTGLTAGTTYSWDWVWALNSGTSQAAMFVDVISTAALGSGSAVMRVHAA